MDAADLAGVRIALVGPQAPPAGGMARQFGQLSTRLREAGLIVEAVPMNAPYRPQWIGRLRGVRALARLLPYVLRLWRVCGRVELLHVMANSGWSFHLFAAPAVWVARLRGVPVVMSYHGGLAQGFMARQAAWVRPTLSRVQLVVPSGFLQQVFAQYGVAAAVVPNSVDLEFFRPQAARSTGAHLVVARNLEPVYDIANAIEAFARVRSKRPDAHMTIAGSGPLEAALRAQCRALGVAGAVHFAGRLDRSQMIALYGQADLLVNPALADNMPNSLLEALACGVPVVSTEVGGVPWMVKHEETALLVPPRDAAALARAIVRALSDEGVRTGLVERGLERARAHGWTQVGQRLMTVYRRTLAETRRFRQSIDTC